MKRWAILAATVALAGAAAAQPVQSLVGTFHFDPVPRWAEDPETDVVCEAIRAECPADLKGNEINVDWTYEEIYDADGMLVGIRSVHSTGCRPLDEHLLLSQRHFVQIWSKPGEPDLDKIRAELSPGTAREAVHLIKRGTTSVSMGC